jgi:hypothetical protein
MLLLDLLEQIEDPRSYHGREYRLHHILCFTIIAILTNSCCFTMRCI